MPHYLIEPPQLPGKESLAHYRGGRDFAREFGLRHAEDPGSAQDPRSFWTQADGHTPTEGRPSGFYHRLVERCDFLALLAEHHAKWSPARSLEVAGGFREGTLYIVDPITERLWVPSEFPPEDRARFVHQVSGFFLALDQFDTTEVPA